MSRLPHSRRRCSCLRRRRAFTLIEALVSISIAALAASVLLMGIGSSLQTADESIKETLANGMANQLIDEIVGTRYCAVGGNGHDINLGPSAWEKSGPGRSRYNDIDDFNGFTAQPPVDIYGIELGKDDGEGNERHDNFQVPANNFDNWREEVEVYYVDESDLTTRLAYGKTSDYRAIEVHIIEDIPGRGERELANVRRIVAYVPPM